MMMLGFEGEEKVGFDTAECVTWMPEAGGTRWSVPGDQCLRRPLLPIVTGEDSQDQNPIRFTMNGSIYIYLHGISYTSAPKGNWATSAI